MTNREIQKAYRRLADYYYHRVDLGSTRLPDELMIVIRLRAHVYGKEQALGVWLQPSAPGYRSVYDYYEILTGGQSD